MAAIFFGTRFFQSRPTSKNKAKLQDRYDSLTPMVTKALNRMGISLWGKNWPWSKKYYIYQRKERWLLCDGVEDKDKKIFKARTKIEVRLRSAYFKIRITRLNRVGVDIYLRCDNLSEWDLEKGLKEISLEITNAELDIGKDDVATLETVDQVAVVRKEC
jgi:hypothetical protein